MTLGLSLQTIGCGSGTGFQSATGSASQSGLMSITPSISSLHLGQQTKLNVTNTPTDGACTWASSDTSVLAPAGEGLFVAVGAGSALGTVSCGSHAASATVQVVQSDVIQTAQPATTITQGGTYTGVWNNTDPTKAAITIATDAPVTIQNATITSRGNIIAVNGTNGANVTIMNVTGTALDPLVAGKQRGVFFLGSTVKQLYVSNSTMIGTSFGIRVQSSTLTLLNLQKNIGKDLEDRASDGKGGLTASIPDPGHFIFLFKVSAINGANISWNQLVNVVGSDSSSDGINLYKAVGSAAAPIIVANNYIEGISSPIQPTNYAGSAYIADGDAAMPVTTYAQFNANEAVHIAGSGLAFAAGNNLTGTANRIVSCGRDAAGNWFAMPFANAIVAYNFYNGPSYGYLQVAGTAGGYIRPDASNLPISTDLYTYKLDGTSTIKLKQQAFTDPCMVNGTLTLQPETNERVYWATKLKNAGILLGDQH
jgi:hypothetical protein